MKRLLTTLALLSTGACATTDPGTGAKMRYHLPRTDASVAVDMILTSCSPVTVNADLKVLPAAGAQPNYYEISGADLASAHVKRELTLTVNAAGVIQGINTSNEDQSADIIGNVIKTAATLAPIVFGMTTGDPQVSPAILKCKPAVANAVRRRAWLAAAIPALRAQLAAAGSERPELVMQIRRLAREQAALEEGILHVSLSQPIALERGQAGGEVEFDYANAAQWFEPAGQGGAAGLRSLFGMSWTVEAPEPPAPRPHPIPARARHLDSCRFAMAVPAVREVDVTVTGGGTALPKDLKTNTHLAAAQFAEQPGTVCLGTGFGEARSVKLDFDEFGRTTSFGWTSSARAATITAAVAGSSADIASLYGTLQGPDTTAKQKAEIEQLETQQRLNELRRCRAVIEAGGFDCKEADAPHQ